MHWHKRRAISIGQWQTSGIPVIPQRHFQSIPPKTRYIHNNNVTRLRDLLLQISIVHDILVYYGFIPTHPLPLL